MALSSEMRDICLPDGMNIFGEKYEGGNPKFFVFSNIDEKKDAEGYKNALKFVEMIQNPIVYEKTGFFHYEMKYHTPKEVMAIYNALLDQLVVLNLGALLFFQTLLRDGNLKSFEIPGLNAQSERAFRLNSLRNWRFARILRSDPDVDALLKENEERRSAFLKQKSIAPQHTSEASSTQTESFLRHRLGHGKTPSSPTVLVH
ncbi:MAG: hypothetical protein HEEMFOPI_01430 [Holosporales bacterium]